MANLLFSLFAVAFVAAQDVANLTFTAPFSVDVPLPTEPWFAGYRLILFILGLSATSCAAGGGIFACIKARRRRKQQEAEALALSGQPQIDVEKGSITSTSETLHEGNSGTDVHPQKQRHWPPAAA
ncbi:hypothetical protein EXIGLDRAFT_704929 [Exidia glandulosa HHB12029]|uniref:Transmembrane protein n=1 Tax=Exidia glandulosa HHB12029 TaxID=1314781 RepID=A0A165KR70_EXIGL|nr:hypothetical protein EXIGLDRAFT_704929 [Exidia glandulosa HHB12029]